jgi:hypothetical protein
MNDPFLKRVLSEWFRDRKKEQACAETVLLELDFKPPVRWFENFDKF